MKRTALTLAKLASAGFLWLCAGQAEANGPLHSGPRLLEGQCGVSAAFGYVPNQWRRWPGTETPTDVSTGRNENTQLPPYVLPKPDREAEGPRGLAPPNVGPSAGGSGSGPSGPTGPSLPGGNDLPNPFDLDPLRNPGRSPLLPGGGINDPRGNIPDRKPDMSRRWTPAPRSAPYIPGTVQPATAMTSLPSSTPLPPVNHAAWANKPEAGSPPRPAATVPPVFPKAEPVAVATNPAPTPSPIRQVTNIEPVRVDERVPASVPAAARQTPDASEKRVRKNSLRED